MDLKIIRNKGEYSALLEQAEALVALDPRSGTDEAKRLDLISLLIEKYERDNFYFEIPSPVDAIKFRMVQQGLKQRDLVPYIGSRSKVSEILSGKRKLTLAMIRALHEGLGIPAKILLQDPDKEEESHEELVWRRFPIKEMVKKGWIKAKAKDIAANPKKIMQGFFAQIKSTHSMQAFYRGTIHNRNTERVDQYALRAWTAKVLLEAEKVDVDSFNSNIINQDFLKELARLSIFDKGPLLAVEFLKKNNIALVIVPHLSRTLVDGCAIITEDSKAIIGMSIRYDRVDNFWFTLMHELVHLWKHCSREADIFVDNLDLEVTEDPVEREADITAGEVFIPRQQFKRSRAYLHRSRDEIENYARQLKIHSAIVAGRIRKEFKNYRILSSLVGHGEVRKLFKEKQWG